MHGHYMHSADKHDRRPNYTPYTITPPLLFFQALRLIESRSEGTF